MGIYMISDDAKELLKDVKAFCDSEIKEQVKEYDIKGEWPKAIYDMATEMQLTMMDVPEEYGGLGLDMRSYVCVMEEVAKKCATATTK